MMKGTRKPGIDIKPVVSVVICVKNEEENIGECLDALFKNDYPKEKMEVIIADGSSKDRTLDIVRQYDVRVIENAGAWGPSKNRSVDVASGKFVAFLSGDCVPSESWLSKLIDAIAKAGEDVAGVGGPGLPHPKDGFFAKAIAHAQNTFLGSGGSVMEYVYEKQRFVDSISAGNALYRKEVFNKERFFEEGYESDDADLNFRLVRKGYRFLYLPDAYVLRHREKSVSKFIRKMCGYGYSMGRLFLMYKKLVRWFSPIAGGFFLACILLPILVFLGIMPITGLFAFFGSYLVALFLNSIQVLMKSGSIIFAILSIPILVLQHFFYGMGFVLALLDFESVIGGNAHCIPKREPSCV